MSARISCQLLSSMKARIRKSLEGDVPISRGTAMGVASVLMALVSSL